MKKINIVKRTLFFLFFFILAFIVIAYGVITMLVMSPMETIIAWILVGIALCAFLRLDQLFALLLRWGKVRWAKYQRYREMDRLLPGWRKKGLKF